MLEKSKRRQQGSRPISSCHLSALTKNNPTTTPPSEAKLGALTTWGRSGGALLFGSPVQGRRRDDERSPGALHPSWTPSFGCHLVFLFSSVPICFSQDRAEKGKQWTAIWTTQEDGMQWIGCLCNAQGQAGCNSFSLLRLRRRKTKCPVFLGLKEGIDRYNDPPHRGAEKRSEGRVCVVFRTDTGCANECLSAFINVQTELQIPRYQTAARGPAEAGFFAATIFRHTAADEKEAGRRDTRRGKTLRLAGLQHTRDWLRMVSR